MTSFNNKYFLSEKIVTKDNFSFSGWRTDVIDDVFENYETDSVLSFPLSLVHIKDKLIWHYFNIGIYNVKNSYWFGENMRKMNLEGNFGAECNTLLNKSDAGTSIMCVAGRVKNFIWKACNKISPKKDSFIEKSGLFSLV